MSQNRIIDAMYDPLIINYVKEYPELYLSNSRALSQTLRKDSLWRAFGQKYGLNPADCKQRWRGIRDNYRKYCIKGKSGKSILAPLLSFLDDILFVQNPITGNREIIDTKKNNLKRIKNKPSAQKINNPPELVTADKVLQILRDRQDYEGFTQTIQENALTGQDPEIFNYLYNSKEDLILPTSPSVPAAPFLSSALQTNFHPFQDSTSYAATLYHKDLHLHDLHNEAARNLINRKLIESQYKDTENILKNGTDNNSDETLEFSKDSIISFFDEIGEYIENRFSERKQSELKLKIYSKILEQTSE